MTVIDVHAHHVDESFLGQLRELAPELAPTVRRDVHGVWFDYPGGRTSGPASPGLLDIDRRLADMRRAGIGHQALSVSPSNFFYRADLAVTTAAATLQNDAMIAAARAHPDRFSVLATLPMQDVEAACAELERIASSPGVRGVMVGTHVAGENLDSPRLTELWTTIERNGAAVLIHPHEVAATERLGRYYLRNLVGNPLETTIAIASLIFGGVLDRHDLRIGVVHGGGFAPYQMGRWDHGHRTRDLGADQEDLPTAYLRRLYFDTIVHDPQTLIWLAQRVGWDRLVIGTDYPYDMGDRDPLSLLTRCYLTDQERADVETRNAAAFLKIRDLTIRDPGGPAPRVEAR